MKRIIVLFVCVMLGVVANAQHKVVKSRAGVLELYGNPLKLNKKAPDFKAIDEHGKDVTLKQFKDKIVVISVLPLLSGVV